MASVCLSVCVCSSAYLLVVFIDAVRIKDPNVDFFFHFFFVIGLMCFVKGWIPYFLFLGVCPLPGQRPCTTRAARQV